MMCRSPPGRLVSALGHRVPAQLSSDQVMMPSALHQALGGVPLKEAGRHRVCYPWFALKTAETAADPSLGWVCDLSLSNSRRFSAARAASRILSRAESAAIQRA